MFHETWCHHDDMFRRHDTNKKIFYINFYVIMTKFYHEVVNFRHQNTSGTRKIFSKNFDQNFDQNFVKFLWNFCKILQNFDNFYPKFLSKFWQKSGRKVAPDPPRARPASVRLAKPSWVPACVVLSVQGGGAKCHLWGSKEPIEWSSGRKKKSGFQVWNSPPSLDPCFRWWRGERLRRPQIFIKISTEISSKFWSKF